MESAGRSSLDGAWHAPNEKMYRRVGGQRKWIETLVFCEHVQGKGQMQVSSTWKKRRRRHEGVDGAELRPAPSNWPTAVTARRPPSPQRCKGAAQSARGRGRKARERLGRRPTWFFQNFPLFFSFFGLTFPCLFLGVCGSGRSLRASRTEGGALVDRRVRRIGRPTAYRSIALREPNTIVTYASSHTPVYLESR